VIMPDSDQSLPNGPLTSTDEIFGTHSVVLGYGSEVPEGFRTAGCLISYAALFRSNHSDSTSLGVR
jgi:hypothetical protein